MLGWPDLPLGVIIKMKGDKDCQRHRSPWSSSSALTCFVFKPSRCWTERFSLVQSRVMPSLACVLWWGCQPMTAPLADHNKVVIDLASPRISVKAPLEAKGSPMWGLGFTLWPSKHSLWAGKKHFTLQMGLGRVIRFLQGGLGISRWLEVSTLFISVPRIESPRRTQSWERSGDAVAGGEPSITVLDNTDTDIPTAAEGSPVARNPHRLFDPFAHHPFYLLHVSLLCC